MHPDLLDTLTRLGWVDGQPLDAAGVAELVRILTACDEALRDERALAADATGQLARARLLADLGHELRTPMNAIIGYSELVADELGHRHDELEADVRRIHRAGLHLVRLLDESLDRTPISERRHRYPPAAPDGAPGPPASASSGDVLVVDDDDATRRLLRRYLERAGWPVRTAADGLEGLEAVCQEAPAVVLLDLIMPGIDGFHFLERLRELPGGRDVPVLVTTAKDISEEEEARLIALGTRAVSKHAHSMDEILAEVAGIVGG